MLLKCKECGNIFSDDELKQFQDDMGECHGRHVYEKVYTCPYCFSEDYETYNDDEE